MTTVRRQNGKIVLRNGKVSCKSFCPCSTISFPNSGPYADCGPYDWYLNHNTFSITEEEYFNFNTGKPLRVNISIQHYESWGDSQDNGEFQFSANHSSLISHLPYSCGKTCCLRSYQIISDEHNASGYVYNDVMTEGEVYYFTGFAGVILNFTAALDDSDEQYRVNYSADLSFNYGVRNEEKGIGFSQAFVPYTETFFWQPGQTSYQETGHIAPTNIFVNGTKLETPLIYPGVHICGDLVPINCVRSIQQINYQNNSYIDINIFHET